MAEIAEVVDADVLRRWAYLCVDGLTARCDEINQLNVFPIPDSDTGTNLVFTLRAAVEDMRGVGPSADTRVVAAALARGAVAGARGNSGVIVSQVLRGMSEAAVHGPLDTVSVQAAFRRAATLVADVVSVPVEGTILTVMHHVAATVSTFRADTSLAVVTAAASAAAVAAVERTTEELPALQEAGVVDAGAVGLLVMIEALTEAVTGAAPARTRYTRPIRTPHRSREAESAHASPGNSVVGFEVVYRVELTDARRIDRLRAALNGIGDSVVVAGDGDGSWSAHVHTTDAGHAVDLGLESGRVRGVRISAFTSASHRPSRGVAGSDGRDILAVVAGDGAAALYNQEGATVLRCDIAIDAHRLRTAIGAMKHHEVLVLPNGALSAQELVAVSVAARGDGKDVLMLPCSAMVQGLAALAVHDPNRAAVDDAYTMSEAAAGTRWGSLRTASERSLTWVGTCEPGDGLGLVGPEVVVIAPDPLTAGCRLLDQLLGTGGEMVTMLLGDEAPDGFGEDLAAYVAREHSAVEVVIYPGGQAGDLVQLGVE